MNSLISVVIINYNGLSDTVECLESLKKVQYTNFRIIIVDNGSGNGEGEIIKNEYGNHVTVILLEKNLGFAGGNNRGINEALEKKSDYIVLLNNDTVVDKDFLDGLKAPFDNNPDIGITTSKIYYFESPNKIWFAGANFNNFSGESKHLGLNKKDGPEYSKEYEIGRSSGCSMMVKTEVFRKIGLLDENFFILFEESEFCYRARKGGFRVFFAPTSKVWHKVSRTMVSDSPKYIYYYTRNNLYFAKNIFSLFHWYLFIIYSMVKSIVYSAYWIMFSGKDGLKRVDMLIRGYRDFFAGKMNKQLL